MGAGTGATWEEVLAECEHAAAEAEALLHAGVGDVAAGIHGAWMPPIGLDLSSLPAELHDRARAIHHRQQRLQTELVAAMRLLEQRDVLSSGQGQTAPKQSILFDRSA
jgi:Na+/glutamate symporter